MKKEFGTSNELRKRFIAAIVLAVAMGTLCLIYGVYSMYARAGQSTGLSFVLVAVLFFLWAWITLSVVRTTRLVLTPEQLEFYSPGLALITSWDNLERIGRMSVYSGAAKYDSLVLRASAIQKTAWWFKLLRKVPEREIPMSMFSNWRVTEMGQEMKKYAPHLFANGGSTK